ncbi:hypothetical protein ALC60_09421 [Trachymyrmex zeteki]|uniref:Uncharacterized protein n=1 Tax=Mycetomoellerius zeteki TaxID=64791 RepID=A0A151WUF8_9HYME|nr:hypothetical protein ALC60_09421 [Trachymyrmex zeteki]
MEKTWTVVQFIDEETVEAVPTTWIINNKCYWPPFQMEKIVAAIKKHAEPNTCWPSYDITTFRNSSYDNYRIAREKAKKAEFTSELASDTDNNKIPKRKVIQKKFSSSSDSLAEDTVLRTPPVMQVVHRYFKEIIRQQSYLKTQLWQITDDLRAMKNELLQQNHQQPNANRREQSIFSSFDLPFNSVKDIEQLLEQFLKQPNNFETSVIILYNY